NATQLLPKDLRESWMDPRSALSDISVFLRLYGCLCTRISPVESSFRQTVFDRLGKREEALPVAIGNGQPWVLVKDETRLEWTLSCSHAPSGAVTRLNASPVAGCACLNRSEEHTSNSSH